MVTAQEPRSAPASDPRERAFPTPERLRSPKRTGEENPLDRNLPVLQGTPSLFPHLLSDLIPPVHCILHLSTASYFPQCSPSKSPHRFTLFRPSLHLSFLFPFSFLSLFSLAVPYLRRPHFSTLHSFSTHFYHLLQQPSFTYFVPFPHAAPLPIRKTSERWVPLRFILFWRGPSRMDTSARRTPRSAPPPPHPWKPRAPTPTRTSSPFSTPPSFYAHARARPLFFPGAPRWACQHFLRNVGADSLDRAWEYLTVDETKRCAPTTDWKRKVTSTTPAPASLATWPTNAVAPRTRPLRIFLLRRR